MTDEKPKSEKLLEEVSSRPKSNEEIKIKHWHSNTLTNQQKINADTNDILDKMLNEARLAGKQEQLKADIGKLKIIAKRLNKVADKFLPNISNPEHNATEEEETLSARMQIIKEAMLALKEES